MENKKDSLEKKNSNEQKLFFSFLEDFYKEKSFKVFPLPGDGSLRKFFRIYRPNKDPQILMQSKDLTKKKFLNFLKIHHIFLEKNIKVPKIYHFSPEGTYLLFEDLGDIQLESEAKALSKDLKSSDLKIKSLASKKLSSLYKKAIDELVKIHFLFLEERNKMESLSKIGSSFKGSNDPFEEQRKNVNQKNFLPKKFFLNSSYKKIFSNSLNQSKLLQEMNFTLLHFINHFSKIKLSNIEEKKLKTIFIDICYKLDQEEKRISHRDYHSKNLMIKEKKIRIIDYQDALLAPLPYDLASLLFDPYMHLPSFLIEELLEYYFQTSKEHQTTYVNKEKFSHVLILQGIQRNFKAIGSFASFYNLKNKKTHLKYIAPALQTIKNQLKNFKEYKELGFFIEDHSLIEKFKSIN